MDPLLVASSPYLQEQHEFHPSSSTSASFDIAHSESPYLVDSFAFDQDYPQDGGHFPHTPSYNGSYQNSPYSVLSDLPTFDTNDGPDSLALFDDNPSGISITEEYDPSEYDVPNGSGLISFDDNFMSAVDSGSHQVSVSITPPAHETSPSPYDHPSPASSNGAEDDRRSHGSSASSYMHPNSPPLNDFTQNFESMHFESPSWSTSQLPGDRRSPPSQQKAHSPPQLVIPDLSSPATTVHDEPPTINAPEGDGMPAGPQLHIVPATPISGGGGVAQNVPFLTQGLCCFTALSLPSTCNRCLPPLRCARCWTLSQSRRYGASPEPHPGLCVTPLSHLAVSRSLVGSAGRPNLLSIVDRRIRSRRHQAGYKHGLYLAV